MSQIELFKNYLYSIGPWKKNNNKKTNKTKQKKTTKNKKQKQNKQTKNITFWTYNE